MTSCAARLSWPCALDIGSAGEHVRVARGLAALCAAGRGDERRPAFVRPRGAITRVGEHPDDPALDGLLNIAVNGTTAHLESVVSGLHV